MRREFEDKFDLIVNGLDGDFNSVVVHFSMIQIENSKRDNFAELLENTLEVFGLSSEVIAYAEDGGSNLQKCTKFSKQVTTFKRLHMQQSLTGMCSAHIIAKTASFTLLEDIVNCLPLIQINKVRYSLRR